MGRKRKDGQRTKSGRLSRGAANYDYGNIIAQAKTKRFGTNGSDAIGRAFESGLLGDVVDDKVMLDAARSINRIYHQSFSVGSIRSAIGERSYGASHIVDNERILRQEKWLINCLDRIDALGPIVRRRFYELCININPDNGPIWLDNLIEKRNCRISQTNLDAALLGLQEIV